MATLIVLFKFTDAATEEERGAIPPRILELGTTCLFEGRQYITSMEGGACQALGPLAKGFHQAYIMKTSSTELVKYFMFEDPVHAVAQQWTANCGYVADLLAIDF